MEKNHKSYSPILITTLNRYDKFQRCVESIAKNSLAIESELVIGLDYPPNEKYVQGYEEIKNYLYQITGFKKVTIFIHEENLGPTRNIEFLKNYAKEHYDYYIFSEDDNEFSPCFLEYMNQALDKYKENENVIKISAYTPPVFYGMTKTNVFFNIDCSAYGIGSWFNKEENLDFTAKMARDTFKGSFKYLIRLFFTYPALIYMVAHMIKSNRNPGDVRYSTYALTHDAYILCPSLSLARNWGTDGSGVHSGVVKGISDEIISTREHFGIIDNIEIKAPQMLKRRLLKRNMPKNPFKYVAYFIYKLCYVVKIYFQYKSKN